MENKKFFDFSGRFVNIKEVLHNKLKEKSDIFHKIFIGTDSQRFAKLKKTIFSTAVILYTPNKGGKIFVCREKEQTPKSLKQKLQTETWKSLETAFFIGEIPLANYEIEVHLDINSSKKHASGLHVEELVGMVTGQGYKCYVKPDSWAAQSVANRFTK